MTEGEALAILRQYIPAEQLPNVLQALSYADPRITWSGFPPYLGYHIEAKVPWTFEIEADTAAEAEELVRMAVENRKWMCRSDASVVQGRLSGEIEIVSNIYLSQMDEGDDAAEGLLRNLGVLD